MDLSGLLFRLVDVLLSNFLEGVNALVADGVSPNGLIDVGLAGGGTNGLVVGINPGDLHIVALERLVLALQVNLGIGGVRQNDLGDPVVQLLVGVLDIQVLVNSLLSLGKAQDEAVGIQVQDVVLSKLGMDLGVQSAVQILDEVVGVG